MKESIIKFVSIEQAELVELDVDDSPLGPEEIAGHTLVSLVSSGTEVSGIYTGAHYEITEASFPMSTGYACVFQVEKIGSDVSGILPGDIVYFSGNHQSYQRINESCVVKVPDNLSPEEAVFTRMIKIPMPAFVRSDIRPPEQVIVTGLGVVGLMAAQLGQCLGYEITACDPDEKRRELAAKCGVRNVRSAVPLTDPEYSKRIGLGVDCSGNENAVLDLCNIVRTYGEVVLVGVPWTALTSLSAHQILHPVFYNYITLKSGWEGEMPAYPHPHSDINHLHTAMQFLADYKIKVNREMYRLVPPDDPQKQYQDILNHRVDELTVMFDWR